MKRTTSTVTVSCVAAMTLMLTSCGAADSATGDGTDVEQQSSVEQGASKEEYIEAFDDIDPVTLTFQSVAPSGENVFGQRELAWAELINEWSGGKVTVEIAWNGSIAEPTEIPDALADGRLDLATYAFVYDRERFPVSNAISNSIVSTPASPFVGELVTDAAVVDAAWNTPEFLEEMATNDLVPIVPFVPGGSSGIACSEPRTSVNDLTGIQSRVSMEAQSRQLTELGGNPVSLDFSELYEALQRGVADCSISALSTMINGSITPVAPYIAMPLEEQIAVGPQGFLGGTSYEQLPLPVQQLVYDKSNDWYMMNYQALKMFANDAATIADENGGGITSVDDDVDQVLGEVNNQILADLEASESFDGENYLTRLEEATERWTGIADELGYADEGGYGDFVDWYEGDLSEITKTDYLVPYYERITEEISAEHRPS